ncbi:phosphatidylglycerophosphatase and protein-tyrosine phosphatase 1 isoform X3 [Pleurodeles waltl]|uniref:phosphatidylglycerophosphatase and protein-tyrosine phosphatase 1 isoform X3 n=1 Tax=Pleurodeles waltl TaxID=8319 RepID=UPI003709595D
MASAVARIAFLPSLLYNVLLEKASLRRWYDRIDQTVVLGALPFRGVSRRLVETENVRGVITMNEEYETRLFCYTAEEHLQKGVKFALKHQELGHSVYIHCKAGRSRSATMAAAYLIQVHNWSPHEAKEYIKNIRPQTLIRRSQFEALEQFHAWVRNQSPVQSGG